MQNMATPEIVRLLNETISADGNAVRIATEALDALSLVPDFPFSLIFISIGGDTQGVKIAAATYLKNFIRRNIDGDGQFSKIDKEFKNRLMQALLRAEPAVLKVLVDAFRVFVVSVFVKENAWPELVPELRTVIQNSNLISNDPNSEWSTINALTVLHALLRPFQYFLNPKVSKEPVPPQLELIAQEILVPLLAIFHHSVEKALSIHGRTYMETEKILHIICKCIYFAVRSYMPSALASLLPSFCRDLFGILGSLSFSDTVISDDGYLLRLKTGKRSLLIFCALITRHRKYSDKLMPNIMACALKIVKCSKNISKLDFLPERIISLAFDVISRVLEAGPGWRLVSPHFTSLLDSAIFPALVMNEKDILEWEDDADEYIRKNLPCDLEEISGWREDLFTARKSAINLLGVISMSKGPSMGSSINGFSVSSKRKKGEKRNEKDRRCSMGELLVLPFLSKFPIPSDANASQTKILNDYYGVLMAYGGLQDFLVGQNPEYTANLLRTRVLPLYSVSLCIPYLVATANWVLGELAPCLPEGMNADVYSSLMKALVMLDKADVSFYPVRASAAGAIGELLENDFLPPEWLPLLQVVVGRIGNDDEEASILFRLLSSVAEAGNEHVAVHIPHIVPSLVEAISNFIPPKPEPWPQVVERGFAALAVMAHCWEDSVPEEQNGSGEEWASGQVTTARAFSALLQHSWLSHANPMEDEASPPPSCIDDSSMLLRFIMQSVNDNNMILELKVSELLSVWSNLIADWHAWEESEDLTIFDCMKEIVNLHTKFGLNNFIERTMPSLPALPVPQRSIIEGIACFVSEAISLYPSATWKACSCVHALLHLPNYSVETQGVKKSLVMTFSRAAFSRFRDVKIKRCSLWKPLLLTISSCYLCYPDIVEGVLEKDEEKGFSVWASGLAFIASSSFKPGLLGESEINLIVMTLAKVVERLLGLGNPDGGLLLKCFSSLMEASVRLKGVQDEKEEDEEAEDDEDEDEDENDDDDDTDDDDEDSEDEHEETEEEFLARYAEAAAALENGSVAEDDDAEDEDEDEEPELGGLEEVDVQRVVYSLIERYNHFLIQMQASALSPELVSSFLNAFPEYQLLFQQGS